MSLGLTRRLEACSIRFLVYRWSSSVTSRNFPLLISTQIPSQSQASFEQLILVYTKGAAAAIYCWKKNFKIGGDKRSDACNCLFFSERSFIPSKMMFYQLHKFYLTVKSWMEVGLPLSFLVLGLATWDAWFMLRRHENTCDASKRDG